MKLRRLSALVLAMIMALAVGITGSIAEETVTLRVLNYRDMTSPNAMEETTIVWEAFQAAHPNIKLEILDEFNESFHQQTEAYAAAGNLPDVMYA